MVSNTSLDAMSNILSEATDELRQARAGRDAAAPEMSRAKERLLAALSDFYREVAESELETDLAGAARTVRKAG